MIIAGTGHRPNKLGGYDVHTQTRLIALAMSGLRELNPKIVISGMALGWDQALARAALELKIPFHAYVPFIGQENMWPRESQQAYTDLMRKASDLVICSPGGYSAPKMQIRNQRMVDDCTDILALWDGSSGGTANCIKYARDLKLKPIYNLWAR